MCMHASQWCDASQWCGTESVKGMPGRGLLRQLERIGCKHACLTMPSASMRATQRYGTDTLGGMHGRIWMGQLA